MENKNFLNEQEGNLEGESFNSFDESVIEENIVGVSTVEDSDELYDLVANTVVQENKEETKRKVKKASKLTSKYVVIPVVLIFVALTFFTIKAGSFTNLLHMVVDFFKGGGQTVSSEVDDYNVDIRETSKREGVTKGDILLTSDPEEQSRLDSLADKSRVSIIISSSPYFSNVTEKGAFFISNPEDSQYSQQVVILKQDTQEELYVSPILDPNEKVEYDYLTNQNIKAGSHKADALFNYYDKSLDEETGEAIYEYIGTMHADITVVIDKELETTSAE